MLVGGNIGRDGGAGHAARGRSDNVVFAARSRSSSGDSVVFPSAVVTLLEKER